MRLLTRGRVSVVIIVLALLAINVVALRWSSYLFRSDPDRTLVRYGDRVEQLKGRSLINKETIDLTRRPINLIIYLSSLHADGPSSETELIKYAEILSQRHKDAGLGIAAIVQTQTPDLNTLIERSLISYDIILDDDEGVQAQLGLWRGESGVFVFDDQRVCRFSTRRPASAEDLRQLVAMEFLRKDPFENDGESEAIVRKGKTLGSLPLVDARSFSKTSLDRISTGNASPAHYVFFTAECSVCSLPNYLEKFREFRHNRLNDDIDNRTVLIFDFNFPRSSVIEQLKAQAIHSPAYIASDQLPPLEYSDKATRISTDVRVAVVRTDQQRTVLDISPLSSNVLHQNAAIAVGAKAKSQPVVTGPSYEEMFRNIRLTAYDVATYQDRYFLTDTEGNRILVVNPDMEVERSFGRIGSGPGRLFHPGKLDIGPDGTIFVEDGGNERIVKFDQAGNYLGDLGIPDHQGLAISANNELYVGEPENGHLITVYSSSGQKLRSFGQLKKYSDVHGPTFRDRDDAYRIAFNRVRLATDKDRNLYVSFMLTPLIQKYSPDGKLLFERRLEAPEIDRLMEAIQKTKYIATSQDGADARIIALDPVIHPGSGNIMVPLVDGSIFVTDREGNKLSLLRPDKTQRPDTDFHPFIAGLGAKGELLVSPFPPKRWYRLAIPKEISSRMNAASENEVTVAAR